MQKKDVLETNPAHSEKEVWGRGRGLLGGARWDKGNDGFRKQRGNVQRS